MKNIAFSLLALASFILVSCGGNEELEQAMNDMTSVLDSNAEQTEVTEPTYEINEVTVESMNAISVTDSAMMSEMNMKFGQIFGTLGAYMKENDVAPSGNPCSVWHKWDTTSYSTFTVAFPVAEANEGNDVVKPIETYAGQAVTTLHKGSYEASMAAYMALEGYVKENLLTLAGSPWEVYKVGPMDEADTAKWETQIYFPIAKGDMTTEEGM